MTKFYSEKEEVLSADREGAAFGTYQRDAARLFHFEGKK